MKRLKKAHTVTNVFVVAILLFVFVFPITSSAFNLNDYNVTQRYTLSNVQYVAYSLKGPSYDYSTQLKNYYRSQLLASFPGITEYDEYGDGRSTVTKYYNCHNYAWQTGTNKRLYCIDDGEPLSGNPEGVAILINDAHTHEISTPTVGCIVVYYQSGEAVHSGIVTAVSNGNATMIRSKWGDLCVVCHALNNVPSSYLDGNVPNTKYYVLDSIHTQSNVYGVNNVNHHKGTCSVCGLTNLSFTHNYTYSLSATPSAGHNKTCIDCGETYVEGHSFNQSGVWYTCIYCGYRTKNPGGQITGTPSGE